MLLLVSSTRFASCPEMIKRKKIAKNEIAEDKTQNAFREKSQKISTFRGNTKKKSQRGEQRSNSTFRQMKMCIKRSKTCARDLALALGGSTKKSERFVNHEGELHLILLVTSRDRLRPRRGLNFRETQKGMKRERERETRRARFDILQHKKPRDQNRNAEVEARTAKTAGRHGRAERCDMILTILLSRPSRALTGFCCWSLCINQVLVSVLRALAFLCAIASLRNLRDNLPF